MSFSDAGSTDRLAGPQSLANQDDRARDADLLDRIRSGDENAFNILVRTYVEPLYRFAYLHTHDAQLAEDVVQDTFAHLWDRRTQIEVHGNGQSYLFRSVRNRALDVLRHQRSQRRVEDLIGQDLASSGMEILNDGERALETEELSRIIQDALLELPSRTREIFMLRREQGMSYSDIASALDVGIPTVRNQVSRATQALLSALHRWRTGK